MIKTKNSGGPEKQDYRVFDRTGELVAAAAGEIAARLRERAVRGERCVLGVPVDPACFGVYAELVRIHREEGVSLENLVLFGLDEYYPMQLEELQSHNRAIREHLVEPTNIPVENVWLLDGTVPSDRMDSYCERWEQQIRDAGGIDILLLGVSTTGHIAGNEPGSSRESRTRLITIDRIRRNDAAGDFFGAENVPHHAVTVGIATILEARRILLIALGEGKAAVIRRILEEPVQSGVPASILQEHPDTTLLLDESAARELTRYRTPWLLGPIDWDARITLRAVITLSVASGKAILKLTEEDYNEGGLQDLLAKWGSAYAINLAVFRQLQSTITGWPGGKPAHSRQVGDRPGDRDHIFPKRILIFSPHPDDDVISMGGTLIRLVDHGHEVHVAYQTSGNIAVFDEDALRYAEYVRDFCAHFGVTGTRIGEIESNVDTFLRHKQPGQIDSEPVQQIKGLIRRSEARAAARCCGIPDEAVHFMDLPFYETGRVTKGEVTDRDIELTRDLLRRVKPHQVYAAGDLSDPHGTHRTCLSILLQAITRCADDEWYPDCVVWLYRGAWQEWAVDEVEMAVPLSPREVERKRVAIFKHESQKDRALFPGSDAREFWQRAEKRNADTARRYDALGLAEYEAIEGFVRWDGSTGLTI